MLPGARSSKRGIVRVEKPVTGESTGTKGQRPVARRMLFRGAAVVLGICFALLLLEALCRVFLYYHAQYIDRLRYHTARNWGGELSLFDILQPSANEQRVFELAPGARGRFAGQPLEVNGSGFRDRTRAKSKPPGIVRIAVLGDSIAFGWGVPPENRYTDVLERLLNADSPTSGVRVECLNFAVPGYNTVMELATLRDCVLDYSPDVLLVNLVNNDDELPNFVRLKPGVWSLRRSFIIETIRDRMVGRPLGDTSRFLLGGIVEAGGRGHGAQISGFRPELVPPEYRFLMGRDNMERALKEISAEAARRGIAILCVMHYPQLDVILDAPPAAIAQNYNTPWFDAAKRACFRICDPLPALCRHLRERGLRERAFWVSSTDFHPNAEAHAVLANELFRTLREMHLPAPGASTGR
jgi:lysophospholipase L1-like esterase